jgi:deoxyadenosine/deoxycytidine kinase
MFLFTVEGNIGSGKSTFMNVLKEHLKHINGVPVVFVEEPVEEWLTIQSEEGKSMIELFYSNKEKYAFSFQMMAYISRLSILEKTMKKYSNCILISERSLLADYYVFAKMLYEDDLISHENYQIYTKWFNHFSDSSHADGIIYLKTEPELCFQRCLSRNRKGEEEISFDYLKTCSEKHDLWIDEEFTPVLKLSDNTKNEVEVVKDFITNEIDYYAIMDNELDEYINKNTVVISSILLVFIVVMYSVKFEWALSKL